MSELDNFTETESTIKNEVSGAEISVDSALKKTRRKRTKQSDTIVESEATKLDEQKKQEISIDQCDKEEKADSIEQEINTVTNHTEPIAENQGIKTGDAIDVKFLRVYKTSIIHTPFRTVSGKFYIWSDEIVSDRVRLALSSTDAGNPEKIIGWVNYKEIMG